MNGVFIHRGVLTYGNILYSSTDIANPIFSNYSLTSFCDSDSHRDTYPYSETEWDCLSDLAWNPACLEYGKLP